MRFLRYGYVTAPILGILWTIVVATSLAVILSFSTGDLLSPTLLPAIVYGTIAGFLALFLRGPVAVTASAMLTSLKSQQALLKNPLDFSIDLSRGWGLFRSYTELFRDFHFGSYMWTSFIVAVLTVLITLAFSVPGAYAVARLRFRGQAVMSRSILMVYMVPMIVLALPIYIAYSMTGLKIRSWGSS